MAQGPRPKKVHLRSAERAQTNQMSYFQTRDKPLRFFSFKFTTRIWFKRIFSSPDLYEFIEAEAADLITVTSLDEM